MYRRRFVSPLLKRPLPSEGGGDGSLLEKRVRLSEDEPLHASFPNEPTRTPLLNLQVPNYRPQGRGPQQEAYFNVLWRNQTTKKNKTWDGDGVLSLEDGFLTLRDSDGKKFSILKSLVNDRIGSKPWMAGVLDVGDALKMGNKDMEVDSLR